MNKLITLAYPRSGSTLVEFLVSQAKPAPVVDKLHGHDMINKGIESIEEEDLLVIIRNYKECIISHLIRDGDEYDEAKIQTAFQQYMKVLEVFEASTCKKNHIYYEDLVMYPAVAIRDISTSLHYNMSHILEDLNPYLQAGRLNYIQHFGPTRTTGKEVVYFSSCKEYYKFNWDDEMCALSPELYNKYLSAYGETND